MIVTFKTVPAAGAAEQGILKLRAAVTGVSAKHAPVLAPAPLMTIVSVVRTFAQVMPVVAPAPAREGLFVAPAASVQVPISIALIAVPVPTVSVLPFTTDVLPFRVTAPVPVLRVVARSGRMFVTVASRDSSCSGGERRSRR